MKNLFFKLSVKTIVLAGLCVLVSCAELDQLTKPSVSGLSVAPDFNQEALIVGNIDHVVVENLTQDASIQAEALNQKLVIALRQKRKDFSVGSGGRYKVKATILTDNLSQRTLDVDTDFYKYVQRTVEISYVVTDSEAQNKPVWQGSIKTSDETSASYTREKKQKDKDKIIEAVIESVTAKPVYPYPDAPVFATVLQWNFEGFALNLPGK